MTREEWIDAVKWISANWPHAEIPNATLAVWWEDVEDLDGEAVRAALRTMSDRKFPPSGGEVRVAVVELSRDDPDHGEAWRLVQRAQVKGLHREHGHAGLEWLEEEAPLVAEAVRRFGPDSLSIYSLSDESTVRAQFRDVYNAVVRDAQRGERLQGLPTGGLRRLERGPRPIGETLRLTAGGEGKVPGDG